jgi:hypothetical protein
MDVKIIFTSSTDHELSEKEVLIHELFAKGSRI